MVLLVVVASSCGPSSSSRLSLSSSFMPTIAGVSGAAATSISSINVLDSQPEIIVFVTDEPQHIS